MSQEHQEDVKPRRRACELCLSKHAVWYCASDDAFLCHVCDESVHSANQVVKKHERVWLRTNEPVRGTTSNPVWYSGFRRKARTPRVHCERKTQQKIHHDDDDDDDDDDEKKTRREDPCVPEIGLKGGMFFIPETNDNLTSLVPEFQGFTEMRFFLNNQETTKDFNFEVENPCYNNEEKAKIDEQSLISCKKEDYESNAKKRNMLLRLNYENVIEAWDKQESPRNQSTSNFQLVPRGIEEKKVSNKSEREARVWRYRDKRKNRLFEKKIRYEVRKVNADKRPRMKGRFVRRTLASES